MVKRTFASDARVCFCPLNDGIMKERKLLVSFDRTTHFQATSAGSGVAPSGTGYRQPFPASLRFKMADAEEQAVDTPEGNLQNEETSAGRLTQFPQTRVRNMMKIDPDLHLANRESVFLLTKAAELFVEYFAKEAYKRTVIGKRKTIQKRDLDATIDENEEMAFLEGTLD